MGSYEKELERLNKLMMECSEGKSEEDKVEDLDDDSKQDNIEVQKGNADTEQKISDTEIEPTANLPYFLGKDKKTKWSKCAPPSSRRRAENLIIHLPGPKMADNSALAVVERLVEPLRSSKRNLTCDNWFTSIPLVRNLYSNYKLTFLGTIRSIRLRISEMFETPEGLPQPPAADPVNVRGRCQYCDKRKNRPTRFSCETCGKCICLEHVTCVFADCYLH
ncbi:hypothetical protein JTB14_023274 [Gonioctena quinquepunctata]|nr:hypothetical protein JTB14_023274 [Gonioctena quinquepunctata]